MLSAELYDKVWQLVDGDITIRQFEDWEAPRAPWFLQKPDQDDADLLAAYYQYWFWLQDGLLTEAEMLDMLRDELRKYDTVLVRWPDAGHLIETGASNKTLILELGCDKNK